MDRSGTREHETQTGYTKPAEETAQIILNVLVPDVPLTESETSPDGEDRGEYPALLIDEQEFITEEVAKALKSV